MTTTPDGGTGRVEADEGGDPACWANRVCPECGRFAEGAAPEVCAECGAELPLRGP